MNLKDIIFHSLFIFINFIGYFLVVFSLKSSSLNELKFYLLSVILLIFILQIFFVILILPKGVLWKFQNLPGIFKNVTFFSFLIIFIFLLLCLGSWFLFLITFQKNIDLLFNKYIHIIYFFSLGLSSFVIKRFYILIHYGGLNFLEYISRGMGKPDDFHYEYESDKYNEKSFKVKKALKSLGLKDSSSKEEIKSFKSFKTSFLFA